MRLPVIAMVAILAACSRAPSGPVVDLPKLLACNDEAVGGDALRAATRVDYDLEIWSPTYQATAHYYATRSGEMRIDAHIDGKRVFSEGFDASHAWEIDRDATEPVAASAEDATDLRRSLEQPGHLWTLQDMTGNGHAVAFENRETLKGMDYYVVKVTLKDGFELWYWLNPTTCHIDRARNFRAFHTPADPNRRWTESVFERYEDFDGIRRPRVTRDVDVGTGVTVGTTTIRDFKATRG